MHWGLDVDAHDLQALAVRFRSLDDLQVVHVARATARKDAHEKRLPLSVAKSITQHGACFVGDGEVDVDGAGASTTTAGAESHVPQSMLGPNGPRSSTCGVNGVSPHAFPSPCEGSCNVEFALLRARFHLESTHGIRLVRST